MPRGKKRYSLTAIIKDKRGYILSIGKNSYIKTHPVMFHLGKKAGYSKGERVKLHAEIDSIIKCKNLERAYSIEVYNYSENTKKYTTSKPCPICMLGINSTNIKYVTYMNKSMELVTEKLY